MPPACGLAGFRSFARVCYNAGMDDAELAALMTGLESERAERTASGKDPDKIGKAICAFANDMPGKGKAGVIFVGVNDDGSCAGAAINDALLKRLADFRDSGNILPLPAISVEPKTINDCQVAVVVVSPAPFPPVRYKGHCWIRVGSTTRMASADEERKLSEKRRGGDLPFDRREASPDVSIDDLDKGAFEREYLPAAVDADTIAQNNRTTEHQMMSLRFLSANGKPNNAAVLCFCHNPRYWLPNAYIQFARFDGGELNSPVRHQTEISGDVFDQIRQAETLLSINISKAMDIGGALHTERPDYPIRALQQYIRNAVMHRDYEFPAPVRVNWFNDRIEIVNPGGLYNCGESSIPPGFTAYRNSIIAEALKATNFVERFGVGIPLATAEMAKNGNPPPRYQLTGGHFHITLFPAQ